ncbi:acyltransferase family protein [Novosphingobium piscinae]|uniref:Acyltransferase n=1 Tax=Novosphingobium piscinae TaxID=1507448 RepID=A0A7X1FXB4_9SPHN|nr:acyltransferase [Novosphingobium piscinae]MBC2668604.1 acyltransferase [Novosphingobium piscinae]
MAGITRQTGERGDHAGPAPFDVRSGGGRDAVLDGLRAVAVLGVVVAHAALFRFGASPWAQAPGLKELCAALGQVGVRMFFLISGYVITRLLLRELAATGRLRLGRFYLRRATRILPQFGLYLLTIAVLSHGVYLYVPKLELAAAGLFLCNTPLYECGWFVGHSWTLAVEEQFYLAFPLLLVLCGGRRLGAVLPVLLPALMAGLLAIGIMGTGKSASNAVSFLFIASGALLAAVPALQAVVVRRVRGPLWLAILAGFALLIWQAPPLLQTALAPPLLALVVFGSGNLRPARWLLATAPVQAIGRCSYTIYLWQELFLGMPRFYFSALPPLWLFPIVVVAAWRLVEKPAIDLGRRAFA